MNNRKENSINAIVQQGMLPLYYNDDAQVSIEVLRTLYKAGIRAVEYTNRGAAALENFRQMITVRNEELPGLQLGIGTIKTAEDAHLFIEAGADYIISPAFIPAVVAEVEKSDIVWIPGCATSSEIVAAEQMGAKFIKLFPGNVLGPGYMSAIKDIFPEIMFMPTGGVDVTEASVKGWFDAGVVAVGMGSKMISKELLAAKDYEGIAALTRKAIEIVAAVRGK